MEGCGNCAGQSETDTRHFSIDGTSFNPNSGAVKGLSTLDANLEVCGNSKKAFAFGTQLWIHVQLCC